MKNQKAIITIVFFVLFIAYFIQRSPRDKREVLLQNMATQNTSFRGVITEIEVNRGVTKVKLKNISDAIYLEESRNYYLEPYFLGDYLKEGMILFKNSSSDTLFIESSVSSKKVYFILGNLDLNRRD